MSRGTNDASFGGRLLRSRVSRRELDHRHAGRSEARRLYRDVARKVSHVPSIPLNRCDPRSSNRTSEPTERSRTVREVTTSPLPAESQMRDAR